MCVCVDVNECEEREGEGEREPICKEGKYCFNTPGSYRCNGKWIVSHTGNSMGHNVQWARLVLQNVSKHCLVCSLCTCRL